METKTLMFLALSSHISLKSEPYTYIGLLFDPNNRRLKHLASNRPEGKLKTM